jgi:MFS family permease
MRESLRQRSSVPGALEPKRKRRPARTPAVPQVGVYFALLYCLIAIPVGWLSDRANGVRVLAITCALWSAATVACGLTSTYPQLVLARMSVGVGEAGGVPPSYALISDYFPPGRRGVALGLYNLGPPIGQALGVAFGASLAPSGGLPLAHCIHLARSGGNPRRTGCLPLRQGTATRGSRRGCPGNRT